MADFTIKIEGFEQLQAKLAQMRALERVVINPTLKKWGQATRAKLKSTKYPPKLPAQKYVRTGQLANRWASKPLGNSAVMISNAARQKGRYYAEYVVGQDQAGVHRGRWWIAYKEIKEKHIPGLLKEIKQKIDTVLKGQRYF